MRKYYYLLISLFLVVGVCATKAVEPPHTNEKLNLHGGVKEPTYPPYCWVSPPGDEYWYPCGQNRTDEELGQHGH